MSFVEHIFNHIQQRFFQSIVKNRLVYNSCWEDPRIDRQLLQLDQDSRIVMLTSAGCNALDYLLDNPAAIYCVDSNPAQTALAELKKALIRYGDHSLAWQMLGEGRCNEVHTEYHQNLRANLSPASQQFWDHHTDYFMPAGSRNSFYFRGTVGAMAHLVHQRICQKGMFKAIQHLLNSSSLEEQRYYFREVEPQLWNVFSRWLVQRSTTMAMLGVPRGQRKMIDSGTEGGLPRFIHKAIREVFTERPIANNYFWRAYLTGSYTQHCCPNYLKISHFKSIRKRLNCLYLHTSSLVNFLKHHPGSYSHFVLLDHQDWIANRKPEKLVEEWNLIFENAAPGGKVLFRSAGTSRTFLPAFVNERLTFEDKKTRKLHAQDRVGTYGSTHLATIA